MTSVLPEGQGQACCSITNGFAAITLEHLFDLLNHTLLTCLQEDDVCSG
jgi:hypothetical protein